MNITPFHAHLTRQLSAREAIALIAIYELGKQHQTVSLPMLQKALHTWTWKGAEAKRILRSISNKGLLIYNPDVKPTQIAVNKAGRRMISEGYALCKDPETTND